jgi:hypothetical protein
MRNIAEKFEVMNARAVKVCAKAMTESGPGHSNPSFLLNARKKYLGKEKSR